MARKIDVLVIGNGPAGNNAAQAVRRTAPDQIGRASCRERV